LPFTEKNYKTTHLIKFSFDFPRKQAKQKQCKLLSPFVKLLVMKYNLGKHKINYNFELCNNNTKTNVDFEFSLCLFDIVCGCCIYKNVEKETEVVKHVGQIYSKIGLNFHFKVFLQLV
jgi:hypothetical protein